jgi:hypothetical protein
LVGTPKGTRQVGKPRHRWEDITNVDLNEI